MVTNGTCNGTNGTNGTYPGNGTHAPAYPAAPPIPAPPLARTATRPAPAPPAAPPRPSGRHTTQHTQHTQPVTAQSTDPAADSERGDAISYCHALGWSFTLLQGKRPFRRGWQTEPALPLQTVLAHTGNVGLRTGTASGVVVIDLDPGADTAGMDLPETVEVATGRGRHLYYAHAEPLRNSAGRLGKHIDVRADGGQVVFPGSLHPDTGKPYVFTVAPWERLPAPLPVWIVQKLTQPAKPEPATDSAPDAGSDDSAAEPATDTTPLSAPNTTSSPAVRTHERARRYIARCDPAVSGKGGHNTAFRVAKILVEGFGLSREQALPLMRDYSGRCLPPWNEREIEHKIDSAIATIDPGRVGRLLATTNEDAPELLYVETQDPAEKLAAAGYALTPGQHADDRGAVVEQSAASFSAAVLARLPEDLIYLKSHIAGEILGDPGRRRWSELTTDRARLLVDSHVKLKAWVRRPGGDGASLIYKPCSRDWAGLVIAGAAHHHHARELRLLVNYPVYGADWERLRPGWHEGNFYDEPEELAGIEPERDIEAIHETLLDLTTDFPFADEASRQNFYGLLLTPLVTHAAGGNRPLHLILASRPRTGKSKLAELVLGGIIMGKEASAVQLGASDEERDKRIIALLREGDTILHLDNLPPRLDSPAIASMLTAKFYGGRQLGTSQMLALPNLLTLVGSGNNVICSNEIAERVVPIVLQPKTANPGARTDFQHPDLEGYIRANRARILAVLLGMVENWKSSGRPPGRLPLGGFEGWARCVGGILQVNAMGRWRTNEKAWRSSADTESEELLAFVEGWWEQARTGSQTPRQLLRVAERGDLFGWIFAKPGERAQVTALGMFLRRYVDTPIGEWVIRRHGAQNGNVYYLTEAHK